MKTVRVLLLLALAGGCSKKAADPHRPIVVRASPAISLEEFRSTSGPGYIAQVRADKEAELSFKIGGVLELVGPNLGEDWREGMSFEQGQVLARLKQADFVNAVNQARPKAELEKRQAERFRKLLEEGTASRQDYDTAEAAQRSSEAALAMAEQALQDSTLVATQPGTILARFTTAGETVAAGRVILKIGNLRQMKVELGVPETVVGRVKVGRAVRLTLPAMSDRTFTGEVNEVGVAAHEDTRLFKVVVIIPNREGVIKSGMTASVYLDETSRLLAGAVVVPLSAFITSAQPEAAGKLAVFVVGKDSRVRERLVTTDDIIASSAIVSSGLKPGEQVVVAGGSFLHDGAEVEVRAAP